MLNLIFSLLKFPIYFIGDFRYRLNDVSLNVSSLPPHIAVAVNVQIGN